MKQFVSWISLCLISFSLSAQIGTFTTEEAKKISRTTTYFVLEDDEHGFKKDEKDRDLYNQELKKWVQEVWTISDYKYCSVEEYAELIQNEELSFVVRVPEVVAKNPIQLVLHLGNEQLRTVKEKNKSVVFGVPFKNRGAIVYLSSTIKAEGGISWPRLYETAQFTSIYKIKLALKTLQQVNNSIASGQEFRHFGEIYKESQAEEFYNKPFNNVKSRVLYIVKEDFLGNEKTRSRTEEKILEGYCGKFKIINKEEAKEIVAGDVEGLLLNVGCFKDYKYGFPGSIYYSITDIQTGEILWYYYRYKYKTSVLNVLENICNK